MVGTSLAALSVVATFGFAQMPTPPLDPAGKIADAIALSRSCPSLRLDKKTISLTLAKAGISVKPLIGEITERSQSMAMRYVVMGHSGACALARERYGRDGTAAAGFVAER